MTLKRRLIRANSMTAPLSSPPSPPYPGSTFISVTGIVWTKDENGRRTVPDESNAVYKEHPSGRVIHKDKSGKWCYEDGSIMPIKGYLILLNGEVNP